MIYNPDEIIDSHALQSVDQVHCSKHSMAAYNPSEDNERHSPPSIQCPSDESCLEFCVSPTCRMRTMMTMKATWMMTMEEMAKEHSDAEAS